MKAYYKNEIAQAMGVTSKTLASWLHPHQKALARFGCTPHTKLLPPAAVIYICKTFCIEQDDLP
jgi:hypothetical protein